jgi:hypothetical protein
VLLWVWVEGRSMGKLTSFVKKDRNKNCIIVKNIFFFPTSNFLRKHGTEVFLSPPLIMCMSTVPNSFKSFAFGTVLYKNVIPLQMYFPFAVSGKIFLHSILNYGTF